MVHVTSASKRSSIKFYMLMSIMVPNFCLIQEMRVKDLCVCCCYLNKVAL